MYSEDCVELAFTQVESQGYSIRVGQRKADSERPTLVLCNGVAAPIEILQGFQACFPKHSVLLFDVPGIGESSDAPGPLLFKTYAKILKGLLDKQGLTRIDILGISWGGLLAQEFTHRYPLMVHKQVLMMTSTGITSFFPPMDLWFDVLKPKRFFNKLNRYSRRALGLGKNERRQGAQRSQDHPLYPPYVVADERSRRTYKHQSLSVATFSSLFWAHTLKQPTLVVSARNDSLMPAINQTILKACLPNSRLLQVDGGHLSAFKRSEFLSGEISAFLNH